MYQPDVHGMLAQILKEQGYRRNPEQIFNAKENQQEWNKCNTENSQENFQGRFNGTGKGRHTVKADKQIEFNFFRLYSCNF